MKERTEKKCHSDMITDGVLAYGVDVGRFVFESENCTVYVISDLPHISASDVLMIYQISKEDYQRLLPKSCVNRIPEPPVPAEETSVYRKRFLCGESAYCQRYWCTLADVDLSLAEKMFPAGENGESRGFIEQRDDEIIFVYKNTEYTITSQPYEPCMYISKHGMLYRALRNAFDTSELLECLTEGVSVKGIDGKQYGLDDFCSVFAFMIDHDCGVMNFTDAAEHMRKNCSI